MQKGHLPAREVAFYMGPFFHDPTFHGLMRSVGQAVRIEHVFPGQPAQDLVHAGLILER